MPINNRDLLNVVAELCEIEGMKVCVRESLKGGIIAGLTTIVGGILLGPLGLAIGGTVGGVTAATTCKNFRPVADVIRNELTQAQQAVLARQVRNIISELEPTDLVQLLPLLLSAQPLKEAVVMAVTSYIRNDLSLQLI